MKVGLVSTVAMRCLRERWSSLGMVIARGSGYETTVPVW